HQAGQPQGSKTVIVSQLPGTLIGSGKLVGRHLVTQWRDVIEYPRKGIITEHGLISEQERVASMAGRQLRNSGPVINTPEQPVTVFLRIVECQFRAQYPVAHRLAVAEAVDALLVDIRQLGVPGADRRALPIERIVGTGVV